MPGLIQERWVDITLGVKRGSLCHAVERLDAGGLVEAVQTSREGRRPERAVYRLSEADAFAERLRDLLTNVTIVTSTRAQQRVEVRNCTPIGHQPQGEHIVATPTRGR